MSAQVAADLRAAADVLRRDGWTQGKLHARMTPTSCSGAHCARGALHVATGVVASYARDDVDDSDAYLRTSVAERTLAESLGVRSTMWLPDWNDAPGRTADEVIGALLAAAKRAEADQ